MRKIEERNVGAKYTENECERREFVGGYKGTGAEERRNEGRSKEEKMKKNQEEEFKGTKIKKKRLKTRKENK